MANFASGRDSFLKVHLGIYLRLFAGGRLVQESAILRLAEAGSDES